MSDCLFARMEWYCCLQEGHEGPHMSERESTIPTPKGQQEIPPIPEDLQEDYADFSESPGSVKEAGWRAYARCLIERIARLQEEKDTFIHDLGHLQSVNARLEAQLQEVRNALIAADACVPDGFESELPSSKRIELYISKLYST